MLVPHFVSAPVYIILTVVVVLQPMYVLLLGFGQQETSVGDVDIDVDDTTFVVFCGTILVTLSLSLVTLLW